MRDAPRSRFTAVRWRSIKPITEYLWLTLEAHRVGGSTQTFQFCTTPRRRKPPHRGISAFPQRRLVKRRKRHERDCWDHNEGSTSCLRQKRIFHS